MKLIRQIVLTLTWTELFARGHDQWVKLKKKFKT